MVRAGNCFSSIPLPHLQSEMDQLDNNYEMNDDHMREL